MITLKEALKLSNEEIKDLRAQLEARIIKERELGAYVEQLADLPLSKLGEGVPIAIKDNIQVKGWSVTSGSKILQGYIAARIWTNSRWGARPRARFTDIR